MKKNPERTEARRMEIICAARDLFLEKGFEATSIRMIQERVGKQVAVFYYYFESKDQVFDEAVNLFLKEYRQALSETAQSERVSPEEDLARILNFVRDRSRLSRQKYANKLHWSVVGAVRSNIIGLMRAHIKETLTYYMEQGMLTGMPMGLEETSRILAYSFGGDILYSEDLQDPDHPSEMLQLLPMLLGNR